jgi:poly(glycerol-phosphate) alpha-glucosyltransferase
MKTIDLVTPSIDTNAGGVGPALLGMSLAVAQHHPEFDFSLHTLSGAEEAGFHANNYPIAGPGALGFSPQLVKSVLSSDSEIVHTHGMWMATSVAPLLASVFKHKKTILSPHGMLDPWILRQSRMKKLVAGCLYEYLNVARTSVFHALNDEEFRAIKAFSPKAKVEVCPNGVYVPTQVVWGDKLQGEAVNMLYLGRYHEKKNLKALVQAVGGLPDSLFKQSPFHLTLVGWGDDDYTAELEVLVQRVGKGRVTVHGPAFGEEKDHFLRDADVFVLPSHSEGLPVAVLEAWANGAAVLMSDKCNLSHAFELGAALDCGRSVESIATTIVDLLSRPRAGISELAQAGRMLVEERYSWEAVSGIMANIYKGA